MSRLARRDFLCSTIAALGGATLAPSAAKGIEPIARNGEPKFKFSLAAYSYRDLLTGKSPQMTLADFVADCAAMGVEGTELTSYYFPDDVTTEQLLALKGQCFRLGLDVSGTAVGNDFTLPPGEKRDAQLADVRAWIERAAVLGAPVIRIFAGSLKPGQDEAQARALVVEGIEQSCAEAGRHGIYLALENHGGLTETVAGTLDLVQAVKSPWFGVNLDTGNFHSADIYGDLAQLAPYAVNVQVKVVVRPAGSAKQPMDYGRLASMLRESAYRGYVVLEYEEDDDPRTACPRHLSEMRGAFG